MHYRKEDMNRTLMILIFASIAICACTGGRQSLRFNTELKEIVIDNGAGLMWCAVDNGEDIAWDKAHSHCGALKIGGFDDWRLPSKHEMRDLMKSWQTIENYFSITGKYLWLSDYHGKYAGYFIVDDGHELYTPMYGGLKARVLAVRYLNQPKYTN